MVDVRQAEHRRRAPPGPASPSHANLAGPGTLRNKGPPCGERVRGSMTLDLSAHVTCQATISIRWSRVNAPLRNAGPVFASSPGCAGAAQRIDPRKGSRHRELRFNAPRNGVQVDVDTVSRIHHSSFTT